jgi:hypothetical protein
MKKKDIKYVKDVKRLEQLYVAINVINIIMQ